MRILLSNGIEANRRIQFSKTSDKEKAIQQIRRSYGNVEIAVYQHGDRYAAYWYSK